MDKNAELKTVSTFDGEPKECAVAIFKFLKNIGKDYSEPGLLDEELKGLLKDTATEEEYAKVRKDIIEALDLPKDL